MLYASLFPLMIFLNEDTSFIPQPLNHLKAISKHAWGVKKTAKKEKITYIFGAESQLQPD